jgi:chromosome segregation ATPase
MAIEINIGNKANINVQTTNDSGDLGSIAAKTPAKILGGDSLKVTSGAMSDLEKLVAQLKTETDETKMSLTQQRISVLQSVLDTIPDRVSEKERKTLVEIEELNGEKAEAESELAGLNTEKAASEARIAELDVKIAELESAIERAVQDGEDHRKQVEELKKQRSEEQKKLDQINTAISSTSSKISEVVGRIETCVASIDKATLNEVAKALRIAASDENATSVSTTENTDMSNAERVEEEKKEAATDIGNVIRESLDKIDDQMRRTIDETQPVQA